MTSLTISTKDAVKAWPALRSSGAYLQGTHGLLEISLGPTMPDLCTPCGRPLLKQPLGQFKGGHPQGRWPAAVLLPPWTAPASPPYVFGCQWPKAWTCHHESNLWSRMIKCHLHDHHDDAMTTTVTMTTLVTSRDVKRLHVT
jgi:hypothetical protein